MNGSIGIKSEKREPCRIRNVPAWLPFVEESIFKEEFGMMTKQAELKKQAYASTLKSRALSVLIYLIDRANKELTCFPAIPTMAEQLHISVSTVKRALHELLDSGYIKKDFRFREKNKGQTSNLYTLVLFEGQPVPGGSDGPDSKNRAESGDSANVEMGKAEVAGQEICQVEHISFADLVKEKEGVTEAQEEEAPVVTENNVMQGDGCREILQGNAVCCPRTPGQVIGCFFTDRYPGRKLSIVRWSRRNILLMLFSGGYPKIFLYLWTGAGFSLMPP